MQPVASSAPASNKGLEPTARSVRCAPASDSGSGLAVDQHTYCGTDHIPASCFRPMRVKRQLMAIETLNTFFQIASVVTLALTFITGAGAIYTGLQLSKRQEKRMAELALEISTQQERAAKAERALLELQQRLQDRRLSDQERSVFVDELSHGDRCPVRIFSALDDAESGRYAATGMFGIDVVGELDHRC